jgi:release factor glutamine methyltransferase
MSSSNRKIFFADYTFQVGEKVYEPAEDSFLFAENLQVREKDKVIDMGTGCGILGILAAAKAEEVLAVDINPYAVMCAKENARLNHASGKMLFAQGDLFGPIRAGEKFDLILFNAPYLPSEADEESSWLDRAWAGGVFGRDVINGFIQEAPKYLKHDGEILLMQSTLSDVEETFRRFEEGGLTANVVAKRDLPLFETIVLLKAKLTSGKWLGWRVVDLMSKQLTFGK